MRLFYSGGNWNNTGNGLASANGNNTRSNSNTNIGFRSALPPSQMWRTYRVLLQRRGSKGVCFLGQQWPKNTCRKCRRSDFLVRRP